MKQGHGRRNPLRIVLEPLDSFFRRTSAPHTDTIESVVASKSTGTLPSSPDHYSGRLRLRGFLGLDSIFPTGSGVPNKFATESVCWELACASATLISCVSCAAIHRFQGLDTGPAFGRRSQPPSRCQRCPEHRLSRAARDQTLIFATFLTTPTPLPLLCPA